jgi:TolB protein
MIKKLLLILTCLTANWKIHSQNGTEILFSESGIQSAYPRLSPDNSKVLFQSNKGSKWQLYMLDLQSQQTKRFTTDTFNNNFPDWSADGKWIAFVSDRDGNEEIYLMKADGTGLKRLTENPSRDIHPYFSPDGKYILFNSDRGNGSLDIYRLSIDKNIIERLTNTPENETCARYSPDMKHIVFLRNDLRIDDVFTLNLRNGLAENFTKTPAVTDGWPMYSADGKWIYFSSMESGIYSIYKMKTDGTEKTQLTFPKPGEEDARVFVSKNNRAFIYNKKAGPTISIMRNS